MTCGLVGTATAAPHALLTQHVPQSATRANFVAEIPENQPFRLTITLPLHNETTLDRLLADQQNPRSDNFRKYLSVAEFTSRFGPTQREYDALRQFVAAGGMQVLAESANRFTLDVAATAGTIAKALGVHLGLYRRPGGTGLFTAPDREPTIDTPMPVLHIAGLDNFAGPVAHAKPPRPGHAFQADGSGPNGSFTGTDIRNVYASGTTLTGAGQTLALIEFLPYEPSAIATYFASIGETETVPIVAISVDGTSPTCTGVCPNMEDAEPAIDLEQSISMAPGLKQVSFYIGGTVIDILNRIATDDTAKQISSSYGWPAAEAQETPVYKEFAAQGQSFVDGTGDDGPNLAEGGVWPADDAWVTAVGGTILTTQDGGWQSEVAWPSSGGGPSPNHVKLPDWQKNYVNTQNQGSTTLRNVPDVAMESDYDSYMCYSQGCFTNWGGTSFSAPRWAGFLALVNQQAALSKSGSVGFVTRALYRLAGGAKYTGSMHDVTSGNNGVYSATTKLDLVTGLGSPQPALINTLVNGLK